jgi:hypothetical protein
VEGLLRWLLSLLTVKGTAWEQEIDRQAGEAGQAGRSFAFPKKTTAAEIGIVVVGALFGLISLLGWFLPDTWNGAILIGGGFGLPTAGAFWLILRARSRYVLERGTRNTLIWRSQLFFRESDLVIFPLSDILRVAIDQVEKTDGKLYSVLVLVRKNGDRFEVTDHTLARDMLLSFGEAAASFLACRFDAVGERREKPRIFGL